MRHTLAQIICPPARAAEEAKTMLQLILRFLDSLLILTGVVAAIIGFSGVLGSGDYRALAAVLLAAGVAMIAIGAFVWRHKRSAAKTRTKPVN